MKPDSFLRRPSRGDRSLPEQQSLEEEGNHRQRDEPRLQRSGRVRPATARRAHRLFTQCHARWNDPIIINGLTSTEAGVLTVDDGVSQFTFCAEGREISLRQLAVDAGPLLRFRR